MSDIGVCRIAPATLTLGLLKKQLTIFLVKIKIFWSIDFYGQVFQYVCVSWQVYLFFLTYTLTPCFKIFPS